MLDLTAPRWIVIAAAALIAVHLALALSSARLKSPTADEYTYISTAYLYDKTGDFRLDRTHPPLVRLLIGAPLQWLGLNEPPLQQDRWDGPISLRLGYDIGWKMLLDGSNDPQRILFWSRLPVMLLSCGLAGLLFMWGRRLYGAWGGLLTLALYCFSPNILAHARLATLDLGACFFMTLALYAFARFRAAASWKRTLAAGVTLGLALSAKATGLLLAPVILAALMLKQGDSRLRDPQYWRSVLCDGAVIFATAVAALLLTYGFPFKPVYYWDTLQNVFYKSLHSGEGAVDVPGMPHLNYAFYLLGDYSTQGWPYYSLVAFLAKTPVAILLALAVAFISKKRWRGWTDGLILGTIALLFIASAFNRVNIGLRHILPVYPLLFLYLGRLALLPKLRRQKAGLSCLLAWFIISSCVAFPDYLPYFNELAGGAQSGHKILDDSNLDWGQDLGRLKAVAVKHKGEPFYIATNWMFDPAAYSFEAQRLQDEQIANPPKGVIAVGKHWAVRHRISRRSPAYFDWLDKYQPIGEVGGSIWLFEFQ